jgi:hypothetical protein
VVHTRTGKWFNIPDREWRIATTARLLAKIASLIQLKSRFPPAEFVRAKRERSNLIRWRQTLTSSPANHIHFLLVRGKKITRWKVGSFTSIRRRNRTKKRKCKRIWTLIPQKSAQFWIKKNLSPNVLKNCEDISKHQSIGRVLIKKTTWIQMSQDFNCVWNFCQISGGWILHIFACELLSWDEPRESTFPRY